MQHSSPATAQPPSAAAPLSHEPPLPRRASLSLSESLQQLQGEIAFAARPPPTVQASASPQQPLPAPPAPLGPNSEDEPLLEGLTDRRLFLRLPESDPVQLLLERYVPLEQRPRRDLSGDYRGRTLNELIAAYDWRGVARYAFDAITQSPPERTTHILTHWVLRFHALLRLRLLAALSAELAAVSALLPPAYYLSLPPAPDTPPFAPAVPFELHLLSAALPGLEPDGDKPAAVEGLATLLQAAKGEMWRMRRAGDGLGEEAWIGRVGRVAGVLGAMLGDIKAAPAHRALLATSNSSTEAILKAIARQQYSTGDLAALAATATSNKRSARNARVLELVARAEWPEAERELRALVQDEPSDLEAQVNLAVVLLYSAKLDEAIATLTALLSSPTTAAAAHNDPTLLFNLCTLYELRSDRAAELKVALLVQAAGWGAQGVEAGVFKLAV